MPYKASASHGGEGGSPFSDDLTTVCRLKKVIIRHGGRVDAITCVWQNTSGGETTGVRHGGDGGSESSFDLAEGEFINRIEGRSGSEVDCLQFYTNLGNKYGPYGGGGGSAFEISGLKVGGFVGRSGGRLDQIACFTAVDC